MEQLSSRIWRYHDETQATSYLVTGRDRAYMIDCGTGLSPVMPLVREVTDLPVALLLTHAHSDHYGAADEFDAVWLHEKDVEILPAMEALDVKLGARSIPEERLRVFDDQAVFDLGDRALRVLSCPGHTPGSVLFVDDEEKAIFSGDAIGSGFIVLMSIPCALDIATYHRSLVQLSRSLEDCAGYIWYPGHYHQAGVPGTPEYNPVNNQTVADMITLCERILAGDVCPEIVDERFAPDGKARQVLLGKAGMIY